MVSTFLSQRHAEHVHPEPPLTVIPPLCQFDPLSPVHLPHEALIPWDLPPLSVSVKQATLIPLAKTPVLTI